MKNIMILDRKDFFYETSVKKISIKDLSLTHFRINADTINRTDFIVYISEEEDNNKAHIFKNRYGKTGLISFDKYQKIMKEVLNFESIEEKIKRKKKNIPQSRLDILDI